MIEQRMLG